MQTPLNFRSDTSKESAITAWAAYERAEAACVEVTAKLEAAGIEALSVKGVITARKLYDDVIQRPLSDVDLRIRSGDFMRALDTCKTHGLAVARVSWSYRNIVLRVGGIDVDIEGQIGPPGVCALPVEVMLARAALESRGGGRIRVPEIHDHALVLCVNVYKDKMAGAFPWALEDFARIVRQRAFDAAEFRRRVEQAGARTLAWIAANWFAEERHDEVWACVRDTLGPRPPRRLYASLVRRLLAGPPNGLAVRVLTRCSADDALSRVRAIAIAGLWSVEDRARRRWQVRGG